MSRERAPDRRRVLPRLAAAALVGCLPAGCRLARPPPPKVVSPGELEQVRYTTVTRITPAAEVLRVNAAHRFVILECTVLPYADEQARVYRGDEVVAELRITRHRRGPFVAADVLEGEPRQGDAVKLERVIKVPMTEEVPP